MPVCSFSHLAVFHRFNPQHCWPFFPFKEPELFYSVDLPFLVSRSQHFPRVMIRRLRCKTCGRRRFRQLRSQTALFLFINSFFLCHKNGFSSMLTSVFPLWTSVLTRVRWTACRYWPTFWTQKTLFLFPLYPGFLDPCYCNPPVLLLIL